MKKTVSLFFFALSVSAFAQQAQDPDFAKSVKEWTTRPEFLSPLTDHLPKSTTIPSPKDVLGYYIGTPKKLTHTVDLYRYYRALESSTKRVKVIPIGRTDEGREQMIVAIGDEDTIRNLDTYKGYLAKLADPRGLTPDQARQIVSQAKLVYMFSGGLHSAETGPPEMLMELAYRLVAEDGPLFDQVRKNMIVLIAPAFEPDGRDRYVDWYYRHKINEETEADRVAGPPYWGKYIYHDNNRDINYSQVTMQNWLKFYLDWHPPIMHDLHESVPFLYTFSGQAPQNPTLDPILYAELPWLANFEMTKMFSYGMPGVWDHGYVDMWSPGYLAFMSSNHNGILRMYETFGNGGANTMKRTVAPESGGGPGGENQTTREWYRPLPPYKEVVWSMRNNTNYMETGVLSALEVASANAKTLLQNFYEKSRNSVQSGSNDAPFGYVFPAGQPDMTRVAFIVNILRQQGVEVGRATSEVKLRDATYPAGSLIIKRNQPYGRLAKILLEKQVYPDPNLRTYDDAAWTMGLMSHADVKEISDKAILDVPVTPVDTLSIPGTIRGDGQLLAVLHNGANSLVTLRYRLKDIKFEAVEQSFKSGDTDIPAGSFLIPSSARAKTEIENLGLKAVALSAAPSVPRHDVDLPRLAMFTTWGSTQDVGWVRYAFDHFELKYDLIYKEQIRKGDLRASYDVIVIPNQGRNAKSIVFDIESKGTPIDYVKSSEFPTLGAYGESADITGGMGLEGVVELDKFVKAGGVLITLGVASFLPADYGLTPTIDAQRTTPQFYAPGPIVEAEITQPSNPIFYGYPNKTVPVRYANGPLLRVPLDDRKKEVLMRFSGTEKSVLSGLMRGFAETRDRPAIVDVPTGRGRVLMFATNPCYRWQNLGEFNMLANAILHYNDVPKASPSATNE